MRVQVGWVSVLALSIAFAGGALGAAPDATKGSAERLITSATKAEISGDNSHAFALLHEVVRTYPENRLAHWQLGEVKVNDKWVSVEEAQRRASADPRQAEYRERSAAAGDNPQSQLAVARWCRKNNLNDEAKVHWFNVLTVDPKNDEALRALQLRWQKGQLVSREQSTQNKEQLLEAKRAAERWGSKLVKWRRAISGHDVADRIAALAEVRAIADVAAIPVIEEVTLGRNLRDSRHADECAAIGLAFLDALEKMAGQPVTESLARHAVFAANDKVRVSAIQKLKSRDQHDYVPMLLSGLGMPIESSYTVTTGPDGSVRYSHSLFREGQESDWALETQRSAVQQDFGGRKWRIDTYANTAEPGPPSEAPAVTAAKKEHVATAYQHRYASEATSTETRVAGANMATQMLNARIVAVLTATSRNDFGDNPKAWWDWWQKQNEYYAPGDHPVERYYSSSDDRYYYGNPTYEYYSSAPPVYPSNPRRLSCFARGTPVWTKTGLRPIESLQRGDLVLAQDVNSGELKYEPVISQTLRPPSPIVKLSLNGEEVRATRGHPFWVAGTGWRMAKELGDGAMLHGLKGASGIRKIESDGEAEAYNLVVADFNTYFVGEHGLLVHDNSPRRPTRAIVPGVAAK